MKRIILTGGGTAGHVTPNIALMPALEKKGFDNLRTNLLCSISVELLFSASK